MSRRLVYALLVCLAVVPSASAQVRRPTPPPPGGQARPPDDPPPGWDVSVGAGLAVTSGNSDTSTLNANYDLLRDTGGDIVLTTAGVYLRGESDGVTNVDRASADARLEVRVASRLSVFSQVGYFRDRFKDVAYLVSPSGGLSVALLDTPRVDLSADGSLGFAVERRASGRETDGALFAGQSLAIVLSDTARIGQSVRALWKMDDPSDALYILSADLRAAIVRRAELKVELLDTYKNRPTAAARSRNDVSFLVSVVYKFF